MLAGKRIVQIVKWFVSFLCLPTTTSRQADPVYRPCVAPKSLHMWPPWDLGTTLGPRGMPQTFVIISSIIWKGTQVRSWHGRKRWWKIFLKIWHDGSPQWCQLPPTDSSCDATCCSFVVALFPKIAHVQTLYICTSNSVVRRYMLVMGNVGINRSINALNWPVYVVMDVDLYNRIIWLWGILV